MLLSDIDNARKLMELLGDDGFVDAISNAEQLVDEVDETLDRVEQIEGDAEQAVREANEALDAVDARLQKFDEAIRLVEAKIETGFSVAFFFFAFQQWTAGEPLLAAALFAMGLLGASSLAVTIVTMPQVRRIRQAASFMFDRFRKTVAEDDTGEEPADRRQRRSDRPEAGERTRSSDDTTDDGPGGGRNRN